MDIKINTESYKNLKSNYMYKEVSDLIFKTYGVSYNESQICKAVKGSNKSFKLHTLICNVTNTPFSEVYQWKI